MRNTLSTLGVLAVSVACANAAIAQDDSARIDHLEQQIQALQQQASRPEVSKLKFNGFFSTGVAVADNDAGYAGATEKSNVESLSLFGLQGAFKLSDDTDVVMQLVSRGVDEWEPTMEWAYISHRFNDSVTARAGKLRMPLYMFSDSLDVGYSQLWARPPAEVYGEIPIANHTGVDVLYDFHLDNSTISAQAFYGHSKDGANDLRNIRGMELMWSDFTWKLRGNYGAADVLATGQTVKAEFFGLGAGYDDGTWQVISEVTQTKAEAVLPDVRSAYITAGYRVGSFTPYATLATVETTDDELRQIPRMDAFTAFGTPGSPFYGNEGIIIASEVSNKERQSLSLGVRWDAITNVAVKFDVTYTDSFGDTGGGLPGNNVPVVQYDDSTVYTIKIDSAF